MKAKLKAAEGHIYSESKPRASLNKCFLSLYCTNTDVYFGNKAVFNSKCVQVHNMHNDDDNLWHRDFWEF